MGQRKSWTKQEDLALINIVQQKNIKKWSDVARQMEINFKIYGRTGKQCRQRWHNQLDPNIKNTEWTFQEITKLFQCHNQYGNKWAKISQQIEGRTDNCVKNYFYSTLRRSLRRLNRFVVLNKQIHGLKELKIAMLSKLVAAAEEKFERKLQLSDEIIKKAIQLKNRLLPFSNEEQNIMENEQETESIILQILAFSKSYKKKKAKKSKKNTHNNYQELFSNYEQQHLIQSQKQESLAYSTKQNIKQYSNLFQSLVESKFQKPYKQSTDSLRLDCKQHSKIVQDQNIPESMIKKSSTLSNWQAVLRQPSIQQITPNLFSSNHFNFENFEFDSSLNFGVGHKNLFCVDVQTL